MGFQHKNATGFWKLVITGSYRSASAKQRWALISKIISFRAIKEMQLIFLCKDSLVHTIYKCSSKRKAFAISPNPIVVQ